MKSLSKIENFVMGGLLWALFFVVSLQFFTRYVLNNSLGWTEEIARMIMIVLTYAGAVVCVRLSQHIQVDLVLDSFPEKPRRFILRFYDLINTIFFVFLAWTAMRFAMQTSLKMSSIALPKSVIYWFCAVCLLLMAFHYLMKLVTGEPDQFDTPLKNLDGRDTL